MTNYIIKIKINIINDNYREKYIKEKLKCIFIRYNPYSEDFDILETISKIYNEIVNFKINNFYYSLENKIVI